MNKKLTLWQKLKIKYHYHWMDKDTCIVVCCAALPTWYLTHSQKKIEARQAAYEAKMATGWRKWNSPFHMAHGIIEDCWEYLGGTGNKEQSKVS